MKVAKLPPPIPTEAYHVTLATEKQWSTTLVRLHFIPRIRLAYSLCSVHLTLMTQWTNNPVSQILPFGSISHECLHLSHHLYRYLCWRPHATPPLYFLHYLLYGYLTTVTIFCYSCCFATTHALCPRTDCLDSLFNSPLIPSITHTLLPPFITTALLCNFLFSFILFSLNCSKVETISITCAKWNCSDYRQKGIPGT